MHSTDSIAAPSPSERAIPRAYWLLLATSVGLALVPSLWPQLDLAVSGYFLQTDAPLHPADWWWVDLINEYVPTVARLVVAFSLAGFVLARRWARFRQWALALAFVGLAGIIGPGLMVSALKDLTLRARPFHVTQFGGLRTFSPALQRTQQCDDNCAFPSGHAADGFFIVSLMLLRRRNSKRWLALGLLCGAVVSFARVSVGAHWLSDVLWALPVTLLGSALAWWILTQALKPRPRVAR